MSEWVSQYYFWMKLYILSYSDTNMNTILYVSLPCFKPLLWHFAKSFVSEPLVVGQGWTPLAETRPYPRNRNVRIFVSASCEPAARKCCVVLCNIYTAKALKVNVARTTLVTRPHVALTINKRWQASVAWLRFSGVNGDSVGLSPTQTELECLLCSGGGQRIYLVV